MRALLLCLVAMFGACTSADCNPGDGAIDVVSSDYTYGDYVDRDAYPLPNNAIATNGRGRFLASNQPCYDSSSLDDVIATSQTPAIASADASHVTIEVTGLAPGDASIGLTSPTQSGSFEVTVVDIAQVALVGQELGRPGAFYQATPAASILLLDANSEPVVDDSLTVTGGLSLGDKWNRLAIAAAPAGAYALTIHAAGGDWPVTATIVDHITDVTPRDATLRAGVADTVEVCFFAHADGVVVAGVPWTFDIDGGSQATGENRANCVRIGSRTATTHAVTAHALGFSATTEVSFD